MTYKRPLIQWSMLCLLRNWCEGGSCFLELYTLRYLATRWYEGGSCCVKVEGRLSATYSVGTGVKQGSVLSPAFSAGLGSTPEGVGLGLSITTSTLEVSFMWMMSGLWKQQGILGGTGGKGVH